MTTIKTPVCYDVSHYKIIPSFALVQPKPFLVFCKATECYPGAPFNNTTDPTFRPYFADLKTNGILRGAFHFHRKAYDTRTQAKHFVDTIAPDLDQNDTVVMDVEEGGETASQLIIFADYVQSALDNRFLIYSRKSVLDLISMTPAQKERLKGIPIWTAGYPYFPDLYSQVPSGYIPDQTKYGPVACWQYANNGNVTGISGDVDLNLIAPWFYTELLAGIPPKTKTPFSLTLEGHKPFSGEAEKN